MPKKKFNILAEDGLDRGWVAAMAQNTHRMTAARMLLVFAVAMFAVSLFALQIRAKREALEWVEYSTALGDVDYYPTEGAGLVGGNDFWEPSLKFSERPNGLYRRNFQGQSYDDGKMVLVDREATGRHNVYTPSLRGSDRFEPAQMGERRYFLKSGENLYIEFGPRKYYPKDSATGAPKKPSEETP